MDLYTRLTEATAELKQLYVSVCLERAPVEYANISALDEKAFKEDRGWFNGKFYEHTKASYAAWSKIYSIKKGGLEKYKAEVEAQALQHYIDSIAKLTFRIECKGVKLENISSISTYLLGPKFSAIVYHSEGMIHAHTILAWGEIRRPHYRFLIQVINRTQ